MFYIYLLRSINFPNKTYTGFTEALKARMYAHAEGNHTGIGVLVRCSDDLYEIGKMAVARSMRGKRIGRLIAEGLINIARKKNS